MTIAAVSKDERQSAGRYYIETTELCIELEGKRNGREKKVERFYWDEKNVGFFSCYVGRRRK